MATPETLENVSALMAVFARDDDPRGIKTCAEITGVTYQAAWAWWNAGRLPPQTYMALRGALSSRGYTAPMHLWAWKFPQPPEAAE